MHKTKTAQGQIWPSFSLEGSDSMATVDSLDIQIESSVQKANSSINLLIRKLGKLQEVLNIDTSKLKNIGKSFGLTEVGKESQKIKSQIADSAKSISDSIEEISKSMEQVLKDSEDIGKGFRVEGNLSTIQKSVEKYSNELEKAKLKKEELLAKGEVDTKKFRDAAVDVQKYENVVKSLKNQIESMKENRAQIEIDLSGITQSKKQLTDFESELKDFQKFMNTMSEVYGGISNVPKGMLDTPIKNLKISLEELKSSFPEATNLISTFEKKLKNMQEIASGLTKERMKMSVDTASFEKAEKTVREKIETLLDMFKDSGKSFYFKGNSEQLQKEIEKLSADLDKLFGREERMIELGKVDTDSFKALERDIQNTINKLEILNNSKPEAMNVTLKENAKNAKESADALEELKEKVKQLQVPPINEENLEKLKSMLKKTEEEVERLRVKLANGLTMGNIKESASDKNFQDLSAQISIAEKRAEMLRRKIQDISGEGGGKASSSLETLSNAIGSFGEVAEKSASIIKKSLSGISSIASGVFSKITQTASKAAGIIKNIAGNIASSFARIGSSSRGLKTANFNLKNLLKTVLGFKTIKGIFDFGKSAIELGSGITEVENVVDTAFENMAGHAYSFASNAKEQFGLSELAAKQYSGTMMAMLKSSGVGQAQAAKMSTTLAGLAGDIASFYNIDTDTAFYKLRSAISGETEPMKQLGVNMNIANLEAFALSRGINKAYKEMTLAEQATLRYNYILAKTTDAQGDFAKTSGSWANQVRLLKLNFESLSAIIGQGLISSILPAIKWLNALISKLMESAKVFRNFMYTLFGKVEGSQGGIVDDLGGISDGMDGIGSAAEEAGKKINKNLLLPIDELNILSDTSDNLSDSLGGMGDFDIGDFDLGDFEDVDTEPINKWAQAIRDAFLAQDWEELGKTLAELVNAGLRKVYDAIIGITPKVEQALKNFAKTFNSFAKWIDWDLLGSTIGAGINLLVKAFNALTGDEGINFEQIGKKISAGFRGIVNEVNWKELGDSIGNGFMVAWRLAEGFIENMWRIDPDTLLTGWAETGIAIAETLHGIFERIDFGRIGATLSSAFDGIFNIIQNFNERMADSNTWQMIADNISNGLNNAISGIHPVEAAQALGKFVTDLLGTMLSVAESTPWGELGEKIGQFLSNIPWSTIIGQVFGIISSVFGNFFIGLIMEITSHFGEAGTEIANGINAAFSKIKNLADMIPWDELSKNISSGLNNLIHGIEWEENGKALNDLMTNFLEALLKAAKNVDWENLGRGIGEFLGEIDWASHLETAMNIAKEVIGNLFNGLGETSAGRATMGFAAGFAGFKAAEAFDPLIRLILEGLGVEGPVAAALAKGIEVLAGVLAGAAVGGKDFIDACFSFVSGILDNMIEAIRNIDWSNVWHNIVSALGSIISNTPVIIGKIKALSLEILGHLVGGLIEYVLSGEFLSDLVEFGLNLIQGIGEGIMSAIGGLGDAIKSIFDGIVNGLKKLFGIHSPSTVMAEIGGFIMQGLINGIISLVDGINAIWQGIKDTAIAIWNSIGDFLGGIWQGIKDTASFIWGGVKDFFGGIWDGIRETAKDVWGNISGFLGDTWDGLKNWASDKFKNIKESVSNAWDGLKEKTSDIWEGIKTSVGGIWDGLKTGAKEKFDTIKNHVSDAWDTAQKITSETWENVRKTVVDKISETTKDTSEKFSNLQGEMGSHGKNIISGLCKGITDEEYALRGITEKTASNVTGWFKEKLGIHSPSTVFRSLGEYSLEGYSEGLSDGSKLVNSKMSDIVKSSLEPFEGLESQFNEVGSEMVNKLDNGVNSQLSTVKDMMLSMADLMKKAFSDVANMTKEVFSKIDSSSIAKNLMDGIADGISGNASSVLGKIGSVASSMVEKFKSTLGIHSPSKVFYGLAEFTMEGFEQGIDSTQEILQRKMSDVASNIGKVFSEGFTENASLTMPYAKRYTYPIPTSVTTNAVINDGQILSGIEEASYRGFLRAQAETSPYLQQIADNTKKAADKDTTVRIGDRDIVSAYNRGKARQGYSFT